MHLRQLLNATSKILIKRFTAARIVYNHKEQGSVIEIGKLA